MSQVKNALEQLTFLRGMITRFNEEYHSNDKASIPDSQYDDWYLELVKLERKYPEFDDPESPTKKVGNFVRSTLLPQLHLRAMYSLGNSFKAEEVTEFFAKLKVTAYTYCAELKYDGLAINILYENGRLIRATTRGDGTEGEDVTAVVALIESVPKVLRATLGIPIPDLVEVHGEALMLKATLAEYNAQQRELGEKELSNCRNAAAGVIRGGNTKNYHARPLEFHPYSLGECSRPVACNQGQLLEWFTCVGFTAKATYCRVNSLDEVLSYYDEVLRTRGELPFDIDGVVIKVNEFDVQASLGFTSREPRWATAFKFPPELATSKIIAIEQQVGKFGTITPVAKLEPVVVGGVIVESATMHNFFDLKEADYRLGDRVLVFRAGDVVPQIAPILRPGTERGYTEYKVPTHCPCCHTELVRSFVTIRRGKSNPLLVAGKGMACPNFDCKERVIARLEHFASRDALDIEGLAGATCKQLVEAGLATKPIDLLKLTVEQLLTLDGFAQRSAEQLVANIIASCKKASLKRMFYSMCIKSVGRSVSASLGGYVGFGSTSPTNLPALLKKMLVDPELKASFLTLPNVGLSVLESLYMAFAVDGFADEFNQTFDFILSHNQDVIAALDYATYTPLWFKDQQWCVTGSVDGYTRDSLRDLIIKHGGKVSSSVNKKTTALLAGKAPTSSKVAAALSLGITVHSAESFIELLK